jgi:hypothetical protein
MAQGCFFTFAGETGKRAAMRRALALSFMRAEDGVAAAPHFRGDPLSIAPAHVAR